MYLHLICCPWGTFTVADSELSAATAWLETRVDQFVPPSNEYSAKKYAVTFAEAEFAMWRVDGFEPPEQALLVLDTEGSITGQFTVELSDNVV